MIMRIPFVGKFAAQQLHDLDCLGQLPRLLQHRGALEERICSTHIPRLHHSGACFGFLAPAFFAFTSS